MIARFIRKAWILLLFFVIAACGTQVSYVPTNPPPQAIYPRTADSVAVFTTGVPDVSYGEIGIMEAHEGAFDNLQTMIGAMRTEAAAHGCDALIITESADIIEGSAGSKPGACAANGLPEMAAVDSTPRRSS